MNDIDLFSSRRRKMNDVCCFEPPPKYEKLDAHEMWKAASHNMEGPNSFLNEHQELSCVHDSQRDYHHAPEVSGFIGVVTSYSLDGQEELKFPINEFVSQGQQALFSSSNLENSPALQQPSNVFPQEAEDQMDCLDGSKNLPDPRGCISNGVRAGGVVINGLQQNNRWKKSDSGLYGRTGGSQHISHSQARQCETGNCPECLSGDSGHFYHILRRRQHRD